MDAATATPAGANAREDAEKLKMMIKERIAALGDRVATGLGSSDEIQEQLEEEKSKLRQVYAKLEGWSDGFRANVGEDRELQEQASAIFAETRGLLDDLAGHPGAVALVKRARSFLENEQDSAQLMSKLEARLEANRDVLGGLLSKAPGLIEKLNQGVANVNQKDGQQLTLQDWLKRVQEASGGVISVKGDKVLVNGEEDAQLKDLLQHKADEVLLPLVKTKAGMVAEKLRTIRSEGQGLELFSRGIEMLAEKERQGALKLDPNLSADDMLDWGERLVRDAEARSRLVDKVKDTVLDFLISYLPNVAIPPIEGDNEGLLYKIENLDMGAFKMSKENVAVALNGFAEVQQGAPFFVVSVTGVSALLRGIKWSFSQTYFPHLSGSGCADARMQQGSVEIRLQLVKAKLAPPSAQSEAGGNQRAAGASAGDATPESNEPPASEPVPGTTETGPSNLSWQPQLLLAGCEVAVGALEVEITDSQLSWLYNAMSDLFSSSLREYIVTLMQDTLVEHIAGLSDKLNVFVGANWSTVASFMEINIEQLPDRETAEQVAARERLRRMAQRRKDAYTVAFVDPGPLGIALTQVRQYVVVKEFRRGRNGEVMPAERGGEIRVGDVLVAFNGQQAARLPLDRVMERLRRAGRPLHLTFMAPPDGLEPATAGHAEEGAAHRVTDNDRRKRSDLDPAAGAAPVADQTDYADVAFPEAKLHIVLAPRWADDREREEAGVFAAKVKGFLRREDGTPGPAEASSAVSRGMVVACVDGAPVAGLGFPAVLALIKRTSKRPLTIRFCRDPDVELCFADRSPSDIRVTRFPGGQVVVTSLVPERGPAELQCGDILRTGDIVRAVNGEPTKPGCFVEAINDIKRAPRPLVLTFGRPNETPEGGALCEATFQAGPLGMVMFRSPENNVAFKAFKAFPGPAKASGKVRVGNVLVSINGEAPPLSEDDVHALLGSAPVPLVLVVRDMDIFETAVGAVVPLCDRP